MYILIYICVHVCTYSIMYTQYSCILRTHTHNILIYPPLYTQCVGVFRPLPSTTMGSTSGIFKSLLICNNVGVIGKEVGAVHLTGSDVKHIRLVFVYI